MTIKLNRKGVGLSGANLDKENQNLDLIEQEFARVGQVKLDFDRVVAEAGSNNPEVVQARGDEVNLNARLNKTEAEVAEKLGGARKAELEDLSPTVLSAIEGGEGTSFNLLSIPQDGSVSIKKMDSILSTGNSLNLFDFRTISNEEGYIGTGGVKTNVPAGYRASAPIPVVAGARYYYGRAESATGISIARYDGNGNYLGFSATVVRTGESTGSVVFPSGTQFVILPIRMNSLKETWFAKSETNIFLQAPVYSNLLITDDNATLMANVNGVKTPLTVSNILQRVISPTTVWDGKTWHAYGTSMTSVADGKYVPTVASLGNLKAVNNGISGGKITSDIKAAILACPYDVDLVTFEAGLNDWATLPIGQLGDTGNDTYYGNLDQCIKHLMNNTRARIATIGMVGSYKDLDGTPRSAYYKNAMGNSWRDYCMALKEISNAYSIPYIDVMGESGLGRGRQNTTTVRDNIHLTDLGGKIIGEYIWSKLKNITPWYTSL